MASVSFVCATLAYAQESWVVSQSEAACLLKNLDAYLDIKDEPVVIFVRLCPETDMREAMRRLQKNSSGLPSGPSVRITPDGAQFDEYLVYSRTELACLKNISLDVKTSPVHLPQHPCD